MPRLPIAEQPAVELAVPVSEKRVDPATPDQATDADKSANPFGRFGELMQGMMDDAGSRRMMEERFRLEVSYQYRPLFEALQLDDAKKKHLEELLLARMMTGLEKSMDVIGSEDPFAAQDTEEQAPQTDILDEEIEELLGAQKFEKYQQFSKTMVQRASVNLLQQRLGLRGDTLPGEQAEQLIDIMYEESQATKDAARDEVGETAAMPGESLSEKIRSVQRRQLEQTERAHERVLARAAEILSERQLAELRAAQEQERRMLELQTKFAEQFLREGASEAPPQ